MQRSDNTMTAAEIGHRLKAAREAKGYSLRQLAESTGIDFGYIGRLERGHIAEPGPGRLQRLAEALDIDLEDLYGLAGYITPSSLPNLPAYLRTKYDLPAAAAERVEKYLARLQREHEREEQRGSP